MKTLEEVINIFEKACDLERRCEDCSGCLGQEAGCPNDGANAVPDALHHLKEYQEMLNNVENDPLSWEELHLLENKPVWVEHKFYKQWAIITGFGVDDNIVRFEGKQLYAPEFKEDMGERWNAYRKERK